MIINRRFALSALLAGAAVIILACVLVNAINNRVMEDEYLHPLSHAEDAYDLLVVGGEPEGVAAAVSGARNGLNVLLVDTGPELGGLMTRGWLNSIDMNYGPDGRF